MCAGNCKEGERALHGAGGETGSCVHRAEGEESAAGVTVRTGQHTHTHRKHTHTGHTHTHIHTGHTQTHADTHTYTPDIHTHSLSLCLTLTHTRRARSQRRCIRACVYLQAGETMHEASAASSELIAARAEIDRLKAALAAESEASKQQQKELSKLKSCVLTLSLSLSFSECAHVLVASSTAYPLSVLVCVYASRLCAPFHRVSCEHLCADMCCMCFVLTALACAVWQGVWERGAAAAGHCRAGQAAGGDPHRSRIAQ